MAISFALVGFGISGLVTGFSTIGIILGLSIGAFLGYFVAGLKQAQGNILQQTFIGMGSLAGKSLSEIKDKAGEPSSMSACKIASTDKLGILYTWTKANYSITLLFDENDTCIGVNQEVNYK
ncbi:MAG: hypothetical protein BWY38_01650 [Ignavibacteria bacterium ADurb.Bin266]|nr:MAG: hypothetical protein BWY38_01650 [Ignavibacteria bacterium ADurb.Bin266]